MSRIIPPASYPPATVLPTPPVALDAKQSEVYQEVLAHLEQADLTDAEKFYFTSESIQRFCRAVKWVAADAIKRVKATLACACLRILFQNMY